MKASPKGYLTTDVRLETRSGDLALHFDPARTETFELLAGRWRVLALGNGLSAGNDGILDILISRDAVFSKRLLVFGDSFLRQMLTMLSRFFAEIVFCRTRFFHTEMMELLRPDVVLTGNVERYLSSVPSDRERPFFLNYPGLMQRSLQPNKLFWEILDAMMAETYDPGRYRRLLDQRNLL